MYIMSRCALANEAVPVDVEKVESGGCAPVAKQARLYVIQRERPLKQWIVFKVDLSDRKVVGGAPVGVHLVARFQGSEGIQFCSARLALRFCAGHRAPREERLRAILATRSKPSSSGVGVQGRDSSHKVG